MMKLSKGNSSTHLSKVPHLMTTLYDPAVVNTYLSVAMSSNPAHPEAGMLFTDAGPGTGGAARDEVGLDSTAIV